MKHILIFLLTTTFLSSCSSINSSASKHSIEAEDMLYITNKAVENMLNCIEDPRPKSCNEADRLLKKYPWLRTREVDITNDNGMRQNDWDIQITAIRKNIALIEKKYAMYNLEKGNL